MRQDEDFKDDNSGEICVSRLHAGEKMELANYCGVIQSLKGPRFCWHRME